MQIKKYDEHGRPYIQIKEGYEVRLDYSDLTEEDKEKARVELRETPENVAKGIKELRELINANDKLYVPSDFDDWLIVFLRPTKFYAKSAYELILRHFYFKKNHPILCHNLVPATARLGFEHNIINFLPRRDQHGRRILAIYAGRDWDPSIVPITDVFRAMQLAVIAAMMEPRTQVNGYVVILDFLNLTLKQCMHANPFNSRTMMEYLQQCIPLRCKAIHIVNYPAILSLLYRLFRPLMTGKLKTRVFFHGNDFKSLHEHIDPSCLRPYYGGTMDCDEVDGKLQAEVLEEGKEEFEICNKFGIVKNKHEMDYKFVSITDPGKTGTRYTIVQKDTEIACH
ncbi:clavesin-2-like [Culicoides brevitarsis]|uniref:clavesin-2-like n=1 Tax=Culicoides brevitarsis TaxID=469753 RepID=UPI00307C592B